MTSKWSPELNAETVRQIFDCDPETGRLTWRVYRPKCPIGAEVGTLHHKGYRRVLYNWRSYGVHRIIWLYVYGEWPKDQIDHINGIRDDNRITNLREATNQQNQWNRPVKKGATTGIKGVRRHQKGFQVSVQKDGREQYIGYYSDAEVARAAYRSAIAHRGEFRRAD